MENYLKELVAMPTISVNCEANNAALDYLQRFFEARQLFVERYTFNGYDSLVATTKKAHKTPKVMLAAHMDVVPGPEHLFALREEDGKYLGRGVFDMKLAIAAYMQVVDSLGASLHEYDFGIMITTEEEIGGLYGVKPLVEEIGYRPEVCVLPDGAKDWQIETFAKGFVYGNITVNGKSAHGSMPWEGDSATYKLVDMLSELKAHFKDQTLNTNTLNIGLMEGGPVKNQIPATATATVDIRFLSDHEHEHIKTFIETLCDKYDATYYEEDLGGHPCVNELTHPLIQPFAESITAITGAEVSGTVSYGASDARFFAGIGVPSIITRPPGGGQHADSEWVEKKGCLQYPEVLIVYLEKVAHSQA